MTPKTIALGLAPHGLCILGGFHPTPSDDVPSGTRTLVLVGPDEPNFWPIFTASPEYCDSKPSPLDRWSMRILGTLAAELGGSALFPFGGPPWHPFIGWALRTGRIWTSPVDLLVHDTAGLFVSFRGALALPAKIDLPASAARPCDTCADQPCRAACPVGALTPRGYDVPACRAYLATGADCLTTGCAVRRACPVDQGRQPEQSAFHMKAFAT